MRRLRNGVSDGATAQAGPGDTVVLLVVSPAEKKLKSESVSGSDGSSTFSYEIITAPSRSLLVSVSSVTLKKLIFYIVHSKYVTKTQKYVKIVGREPSFFHHQRPAGVLALWPTHPKRVGAVSSRAR